MNFKPLLLLILSCFVGLAGIMSFPFVRREVNWAIETLESYHMIGWVVSALIVVVTWVALALCVRSIFVTYYLHRRVPRNHGGARRNWYDEHRDLLEDLDSLPALDKIVVCPADGLNARPGRVLAKRCGGAVRRAMGFPDRTKANMILACQRCDAWLRESCPTLRASDFGAVHARSVVVALTATADEEKIACAIFSPRASKAQLNAHTPHLIPEYEATLGRVLSYFGFEVPAVENFQ